MKSIVDPDKALSDGLVAIRTQFQVPSSFPASVLHAAEQASRRTASEHVDRTNRPFVTLDPASSTDLDQAFAIEDSGGDILLHYAIADVAWFVDDGGAIDTECWARGETLYLPDGKAGLHPPILAEGAASLLPDGPRPCVIFTVRIDSAGQALLDGVERAIIQSRAKLAYETVTEADLPRQFGELAKRVQAAERARGAARVDPPQQEVVADGNGHFRLAFAPRLQAEDDNAALSLATNLAVASALQEHGTGLFRVMSGPDARAIARLRLSARALGLDWPTELPLEAFERTLNANDARQAAFMLAIRRAGDGASYQPYRAGVTPWHAAMAATYAQATAPLRRLADRYVVLAALAVANGRAVPDTVTAAFEKLPPVMAKADARSAQIERAVIDLAEASILQGQEQQLFDAVVTDTDERGARIQLCDYPVIARVDSKRARPGDRITVKLISSDPVRREVRFERMA